MELTGKAAIVTGAGQGIGRATALALARKGANVVLAELVAERAQTVAEEVRALGREALDVTVDVSNSVKVREMVEAALGKFGRIDILVNNAGVGRNGLVVDMEEETWDLVMDVDLKGVFLCCRAVLPTMIRQKSGAIVNVASVSAWFAAPKVSAYNAAKAGVVAFTKSLATEVAEHNIRVNAVAPAMVDTPLYWDAIDKELFKQLLEACPMHRMCTPEEIADPIVFLASNDARWITGDTVTVSGGLALR